MEGEGRRWYVRNVPGADNPFPLGAGCCAEPTSGGRGRGLLLRSEMEGAQGAPSPRELGWGGLGEPCRRRRGGLGGGGGGTAKFCPICRGSRPHGPPGLRAVGGCWVLGLASLPVPGLQRGQAASGFGGLGAEGAGREPWELPGSAGSREAALPAARGDNPGEGVPAGTACSCDFPGDSLPPGSRLSPHPTL